MSNIYYTKFKADTGNPIMTYSANHRAAAVQAFGNGGFPAGTVIQVWSERELMDKEEPAEFDWPEIEAGGAVRTDAWVPGHLNVSEAAQVLGVKEARVRQLLNAGKMKGVKKSGVWMIPPEEVQRYKSEKPAYRDVIIKSTGYICQPNDPRVHMGRTPSGATNFRITGVPLSVTLAEVAHAAQRTGIWLPDGPYEIPWDMLGEGKTVTKEKLAGQPKDRYPHGIPSTMRFIEVTGEDGVFFDLVNGHDAAAHIRRLTAEGYKAAIVERTSVPPCVLRDFTDGLGTYTEVSYKGGKEWLLHSKEK